MIVIRGGEVLTRTGWRTADVAIAGTAVSAIEPGMIANVEIDATGCLVGPGFIDLHTHLREPGQTWKEDIASASAAAASGGFTAVTAMPNTDPPMDTAKIVESVKAAAADVDLVDVLASGALTVGRAGTEPSDIEDLYRSGVRLFTDDGDCVSDPSLMEDLMRAVASHPGAFVAQHAEDHAMTAGSHMHEGGVSRKLGIAGMPPEAEASIVARDIGLARETGVGYHCQHVSTKMTVELIRGAKKAGLKITAEVTPHHLVFDDTSLTKPDTDYKMYPPLRSSEDRAALVDALADGTLDAVATDHAPHLPQEKAVPFDEAPRGVIGLETAASATWETLDDRDRLFGVLSTSPAAILGLADQGRPLGPGDVANIVVFDPTATWTASRFRSKSSNSPFRGRAMKGQVRATIRGGRVIYSNGDIPL